MGIMLLEYLDVIDQQRPDHPDRITTPRTAAADTGRTHRAAPRGSGQDRARRLDGRVERADRAVAAGVRGHRAQMATPLVRRTGVGGTGRCETVRPPTGVHPRAGRPGQGVGLHPAGRAGAAPVAVVVPGAGPPRRRRRDLRVDLAGHGAPVAVRGRAQTLAVPVVDLHHRSRLRRQGRPSARPVRPNMGGKTAGLQRS